MPERSEAHSHPALKHALPANLALMVVQVLAARVGVAFAGVDGTVSLVWPPAGIALAVLVLYGPRLWPGVAAGAMLSALLTGAPFLAALFNATGITLATMGAMVALRRARFDAALCRVSDVVGFVVMGAVAAPIVSATVGTTGLLLAGRVGAAAWGFVAWKWWLGDATGVLVVGAAILAVNGAARRALRPQRWIEGVALALAIVLVGAVVLAAQSDPVWGTYPLPYLYFPLLIIAAFRFGPAGAAVASLLIASLSVYAASHGFGTFAVPPGERGLALLSLFIAVVAVTGLFVAAVIAERSRASAERARLASIIQATSDLVCMIDAEGHVLFVNHAGRALLGFDDDEDLTGRAFADFHAPESGARVRDVGIPAATASGSWLGESTLRHRAGHSIAVSQVIVAHRDGDGDVQFLSTIARDLTERVRLEQQLIRAQKMEAVGRLAGGVAHDFNNLLTVILGQARLAEEALDNGHAARASVEDIAEAAARAATLTHQLLAFARRQHVEPRTVDLNVLVRRTDRMLRRVIGEDVTLITHCAPDLLPVCIDPGQVEQLLVNLAVNARDAMPEGGTLTIETRNVEHTRDGQRPQGQRHDGRWVSLSVRDTGAGMDEQTLSHVFEPFFTTKGPEKGTGLGLATCYGIVTQAGGSITAESRPGEGASFVVLLPAADGPVDDLQHTGDDEVPAGRGTILLVEDEAAVRNLARRALEKHGYQVLTAADGCEAIELVGEVGNGLDLIVTDMVMPRMSGPQFVERLRAEGNEVKVLFISGYVGEAQLSAGTPFLAKPFTPLQLAGRVQKLLEE